jgi:hypothetical protein
MQFIRGQTLAAVIDELRRAPDGSSSSDPARSLLPADRGRYFRNVARVGAEAADALDHAHRQGVVHRDVKPANLLLDARGSAWVSDFGLAKVTDAADLTDTGDILGTLAYMAPEQLAGQADHRADVYGLGVTLYELATLRPAFRDEVRIRLIDKVRSAEPAAPRAVDPQIPRDLETVILKAMAKELGRRYQSAAELADDLERAARGEPTAVRPPSWPRRVWKRARRRPAVAAAVALLLAGGGVLAVIPWKDRPPVEVLDRAARRGEKLTLVGPVGHPIYHRWADGVGQLGDPKTGGPFAVRAEGIGMIELLPDTHTEWYRFSAEFQMAESTDPNSWAGLYIAHKPGKPGPTGTADRAVLVGFQDDLLTNRPANRNLGDQVIAVDAIIGHGVQDDLCPISDSWIRETKTTPRLWRRIVVDVDPEWIRVSFWRDQDRADGRVVLRPIRAESLCKRTVLHHARLRQQWPEIDPGDLTYSPRGRLGVYVHNAKVFFRNVEFTPTANP